MDHTEVSGGAGFLVMDLASWQVLHAAVAPDYGGEHVSYVLRDLIGQHGAPLVIKSDNGSPLISEQVRAILRKSQIESLRSPVRRPSYNRACEAMVGEVKRAAEDLALEWGGAWSRWLPRAGALLNSYEREDIGVPESIWEARPGDLGALRESLGRLLRRIRGLARPGSGAHSDRRKAERSSLRQALCELQILKIERP